MITTDEEWMIKTLASVVKSLVSILRVKLFMDQQIWFGIAHILHKVVVDIHAAFFDSNSLLPLAAQGNNRRELSQFFHFLTY